MAIKLVDAALSIRYIECGSLHPVLTRRLAYVGFSIESLNLWETARNAVLGSRSAADKLILKSPVQETRTGTVEDAKLHWVTDCSVVLANSAKSVAVMERLIRAAEGRPACSQYVRRRCRPTF